LQGVYKFNVEYIMTDPVNLGEDSIWTILVRFFVNLLVLFILIRLIYYRFSKKKELAFPFFLMGIMIFFMCFLLKNVQISLGIGFGLFALFSILRFRTKNLTAKVMSYFFAIIGISAINSLTQFKNPILGPILINSLILLSVLLLEVTFRKIKPQKEGTKNTPKEELTANHSEKLMD
jgi:hypothetical protein